MTELRAIPEPVSIDFSKSAIIVVDMQNGFASKGGMLDIAGADLSGAPQVIQVIRSIVDTARQSGISVVYLRMGYKPDLSNSGGPDSPNPQKELALRLMSCKPELRGKLLIEGTWDHAIVDELKPKAGDLIIDKTRYSGFAHTTLDAELRSRGLRYLFFTGIATNVCVESTLRDAFFLDYWPILIADATMPAGPAFMQDATLNNISSYFGWIIQSEEFLTATRLRGNRTSGHLPRD